MKDNKDNAELLDIVQTALGTFDHRQSFTPGMFEPLKPLFRQLGYDSAAVYITEDYPDRMHLICGYGGEGWLPTAITLNRNSSLCDELMACLPHMKGLMAAPLFNHDRELGVLAVTVASAPTAKMRKSFDTLVRTLSIMAYVERIRTNSRREREERDVFFAQSLTNRLLIHEAPKMKQLRLGFEFIRSLEAGGDFFDFVPEADGGLIGFVGCCSGKGLRTVLEVSSIMRVVHRALHGPASLSEVLLRVNDMLIKEMRRAHQASLCLFHVDLEARKLRLAKAGRLGILLCGPGSRINNISAPGAAFLGMVAKPHVQDEEYDFKPGQSFFCVTEGFYSSKNVMNARPQVRWFLESVAAVLEDKPKKPLANAIFDAVNRDVDHTNRPDDSMLAISVEFTNKTQSSTRRSVRIR